MVQESPEPSARITGARRTSQSLGAAWDAFWRHPSPWLMDAFLLGSCAYRATMATFSWTELIVPAAMVAFFPAIACTATTDPGARRSGQCGATTGCTTTRTSATGSP
jgi:hypothetical protein